MPAMPLRFAVGPGERETLEFSLTPTARGMKFFEAGQLRLRSILGLLDWNLRIGPRESRRVFPNFKRQASLAWLASDRRLAELGIKNRAPPRRRHGLRPAQRIPRGRSDATHRLESNAQARTSHRAGLPGRARSERDVPARLRAAHARRRYPVGHRCESFRPVARCVDAADFRRAGGTATRSAR